MMLDEADAQQAFVEGVQEKMAKQLLDPDDLAALLIGGCMTSLMEKLEGLAAAVKAGQETLAGIKQGRQGGLDNPDDELSKLIFETVNGQSLVELGGGMVLGFQRQISAIMRSRNRIVVSR